MLFQSREFLPPCIENSYTIFFQGVDIYLTLFLSLNLSFWARRLEALAVDNAGAGFVVFLLGDPHLLEGGEGSQDGTTDPDGVFAFWWGNDLDLDGGWGQGSDFLLHAIGNTGVHGGATRHDNVGVQVLTDIYVTLHDGVVDGLEEGFWATETFVTDGDDLTVGKFIGFLQGGGGGSGGHFLFEVQGNIAQFFLDVTNDFTFSGGGERVATFSQDLHQVIGQIATSQIQTEDGVGQGITFIDGDGVGDTITRIQNDTSGTTGSVQGEYGLDGNIHGGGVEGFKHDLGHLLTVSLGVQGGFSQQNGVLFRSDTQFVVESVMPDLFHIIPVGDDTVFNGVLKGQDTSLGLGFIADIRVLLAHTDHDTLMAGTTYNGGEDGTGSIITGETSFAHTGTVVND
ncbi:hypothetical protein FF38_12759 [Lucilia cuprina]|uniref:Uncharacterized protein n=1 Tax=Lucilia cuprina TaxID=7375 RepID=A0A0L0CH19_LUCCU|nr:hypothetical protein FF38_12759 [Lucilia cuprina]